MIWSPQQDEALCRVGSWLKDPDRKAFFYLAGFAGTGKTTLAKHLAANLNSVFYAAPTGKAASVMRSMGCVGAMTVHQLIYKPKDASRKRLVELETEHRVLKDKELPSVTELRRIQELIRELEIERSNLSRPYFDLNTESHLTGADLLVVDEGSMVNEEMGKDLLSFGVPVLVLGDPGQLPPVFGYGYFTKNEPDFVLTEVHRQALDSPVLRMATHVRTEGRLRDFGPEATLLNFATPELALAADQLLVGRNATRMNSNARIRQLKGIEAPLPVTDERLVCLRNNHEVGILNGEIYVAIADATDVGGYANLRLRREDSTAPILVPAHKAPFIGGDLTKMSPWDRREAEEFTYGYALTVHKAQGSQFGSVLIVDDWNSQDYWRWVYTAITRAQKSVAFVRKS